MCVLYGAVITLQKYFDCLHLPRHNICVLKMMRKLWNFGQVCEFEEYGAMINASNGGDVDRTYKLYEDSSSPPPPYSEEDLLRFPLSTMTPTKPSMMTEKPLRRKSEPEEEELVKKGGGTAEKKRKQSYSDVGEEIIVTVGVTPNEEIGLILLSGESFSPSLPTILDIKNGSPAYHAIPRLKIGDQIKELDNILTESLTHAQVIALFSKATDSVTMTLRRGVEPTKREFQWFQFPFLSVNKRTDELLISSASHSQTDLSTESCENVTTGETPSLRHHHQAFSTFKDNDSHGGEHEKINEKPRFQNIQVDDVSRCKFYTRSLSASAASKCGYLTNRTRQRRNTMNETTYRNRNTMILSGYFRKYDLAFKNDGLRMSDGKREGGKYIADEIERLSLSSSRQKLADSDGSSSSNLSRNMSKSSLSSAVSSLTVSSLSSTSTLEQVSNIQKYLFNNSVDGSEVLENIQDHNEVLDLVSKIHTTGITEHHHHINNIIKTPVNKLRESFRRKKSKTANVELAKTSSTTTTTVDQNSETTGRVPSVEQNNTLSVTVWVPDRRKLGLKLGGGSVSLYGDSNICVVDIKRAGTAVKHFKVGDELLEIDGSSTHSMDVFQVNRLISKLEGNFVEFKIFRPNSRTSLKN